MKIDPSIPALRQRIDTLEARCADAEALQRAYVKLEARCREQESALLMCEEYFVAKGWAADRGPLLEKVQKALSSTAETSDQVCVHGIHVRQRCYQCDPAHMGSAPETAGKS